MGSQKERGPCLPAARGHGMKRVGRRLARRDKELGHLPQIPQLIHNYVGACLPGKRQLTEPSRVLPGLLSAQRVAIPEILWICPMPFCLGNF